MTYNVFGGTLNPTLLLLLLLIYFCSSVLEFSVVANLGCALEITAMRQRVVTVNESTTPWGTGETNRSTCTVLYVHTFAVDHQQSYIESAATSGNQPITVNERLLDILQRRSVADFNNFTDCLVNTGQQHLASLFDTGGGLAFCSFC